MTEQSPLHPVGCACRSCSDLWEEIEADNAAFNEPCIEVCTNCGGYFTPRKGQDYYDTRCGRCG